MIPETDADVPAFWQDLGLSGLYDVHVHFLPPPIQAAVWREFDNAGPKIGRDWPIRYRGSVEERVDQLRAMGVRRFGALPYAHKPGVASYLNEWARTFAADHPDALWCGTFYPEDGVGEYVDALVRDGIELFKLHVQVGEFRLDDPLLDPAWATLTASRVPVVIHVGSGPVPGSFTGPDGLEAVLRRFPDLTVIVAHMGAPEFAEFLSMAERYERVFLDTTMVFVSFFDGVGSFPDALLPRLGDLGPKVLLGTDFPTIPYPYAHQLESLARLRDREPRLDDAWLREVCWSTPERVVETR